MKVIEKEKGITELVPEDTLDESIIAIRVDLQNSKLKKSGHNKSSNFDYFELRDFLPRLNELMRQEKVNDIFTIKDDKALLCLKKGQETNEYAMPFKLFDTPIFRKWDSEVGEYKEVKSCQDVQYLGALNTYYKRYLYINAFGITDGDVIDSLDNENLEPKKKVEAKENILEKADKEIDLDLTKEFNDVLVQTGTDLDDILNYYNKEKKKDFKLDDMTEAQKKEAIAIMKKKGSK